MNKITTLRINKQIRKITGMAENINLLFKAGACCPHVPGFFCAREHVCMPPRGHK